MFVAADWSFTRNGPTIDARYIGDGHAGASPSYVTGIEFHRAVSDFSDDEVDSGDDEIAIIDDTPSDRAGADTNIVLLGVNIDDTAAEHIYDCSITQDNGDTIYDGIQVFGNATSIQIIQNGAKITNDFWNEANMRAATADSASSTTHRFMVKVRSGGADIDGRRLLGTQRVLGTQYSEFFIGGGTVRGNNSLPLTANFDGNNQTAAGTIATWTDIVNDNEGYVGIDADGNGANEFYYSNWELGSRTDNNLYERAKWIQREGSTETIYGLNGELFRGITHEIDVDTPTGTFAGPEEVTWAGGTGQLLAIDSPTAGTKMWIQLLTGVIPTDGQTITGTTSSATVDVNATVTSITVSPAFIGNSTGTAINPGAYGIGIGADDLENNDLLTDLTGTTNQPPNNVTYTQGNLVSGDRVLVGPRSGGVLQVDQLGLQASLTGAAVTSIQVDAAIPTDTPASGTIRVQNDAGRYIRVPYTSYTGDTFTVTSTDFSGENATAGNNVFISYIDGVSTGSTMSFTSVFLANRELFARVRNSVALIKPFDDANAQLTSTGGSSTTSRISDA